MGSSLPVPSTLLHPFLVGHSSRRLTQTVVGPDGLSTTTLFRALRKNKEERVARLEWAPNGGLGRAQIGKVE